MTETNKPGLAFRRQANVRTPPCQQRTAVWDDRLLRCLSPSSLRSLPAVWRYGLAALLTVAVTVLRRALIPGMGTIVPYNLGLPTVLAATVLFGFGPGLLSVLVGVAGVEWYVLDSLPTIADGKVLARIGMSLAVGVFAAGIVHAIRASQIRAHASEARYRSLVELSPEAIVAHRDGRFIFANPAALRLYGASSFEELEQRSVLDLIHPEDREMVRARMSAATGGEQFPLRAIRALRLDGQILHVESVGGPVDFGGRPAVHVFVRDVSEHRRTEEALRLSEETFAKTFHENAAAMALTRFEDGRVLDVNERWLNLLRLRREDVLGSTTIHQGIWNDPADRAAMLRELEQHGAMRDRECTFLRKNGEKWTALLSACLIHIRDERIVVSSAIDITTRKRAEVALRQREEQLKLIVSGTPDHILVQDRELRYVFVANPQLGLTEQEMLGRTDQDLLPGTEADKLTSVKRQVMDSGQTLRMELSLPSGRGTPEFFSGVYIPRRNTDGEIDGLIGYFRNETKQRRVEELLRQSATALQATNAALQDSRRAALNLLDDAIAAHQRAAQLGEKLRQREEQLRIFVEHAPAAIAMLDKDLRYVAASRRWLADYGLADQDVRGRAHYEVFPEIPPRWKEIHRRCLAGAIERSEEDPFDRADGTRQWLRWEVRPWYAAAGAIGGIVVFSEDVTDRKRAEESMKSSLREKELLLKEIHHRVKNNMQVISSLVSLQADALENPALHELFGGIRDQIRAMALVHEKLYRSEDLAGVEFAEYCRSLLDYLWRAHGAAAADVQLRLDLQPVLLSVEMAVPCGLILNELSVNALKHAFRGRTGGEVTVSLHREPDGRVRLCVGDNGVGLPAGVDWRQSRSLGLRLVRMLASQLNGTLTARSSGDGTEFTVVYEPPPVPRETREGEAQRA